MAKVDYQKVWRRQLWLLAFSTLLWTGVFVFSIPRITPEGAWGREHLAEATILVATSGFALGAILGLFLFALLRWRWLLWVALFLIVVQPGASLFGRLPPAVRDGLLNIGWVGAAFVFLTVGLAAFVSHWALVRRSVSQPA